jgi:hypothetical protein
VRAQVIPVSVSSSTQNWNVQIEAKLVDKIRGEEKAVQGSVSREIQIDDRGFIHLLLFAGTSRKPLRDGYWYLRVGPHGSVGDPIPLGSPPIPDDQQTRHLSLDSHGVPLLMWPDKKGVGIISLKGLCCSK